MKKILNVPYIDQTTAYPTGCESISTVMLLHYLGLFISPEEFIDEHLPKADFYCRSGRLYGPDPRLAFIGSPYNMDIGSYGCYAPVIVQALRSCLTSLGQESRYLITDETGSPVSYLIEHYIMEDLPVIFWATLNMLPPAKGPTWLLAASDSDSDIPACEVPATFTWKNNEHCLLLTGFDDANYYFNDPWENHGLIGYPRSLVEERYAQMGAQAITCRPTTFASSMSMPPH